MICSCSMYSIRMNGSLNVPFLAVDDNQACDIVEAAFKESNYVGEFDVVKIGSFNLYDGVKDVDHEVIRSYNLTADYYVDNQEVIADDVQETF